MSPRTSKLIICGAVMSVLLAGGCAAHRDYRQAHAAAKRGNWDLAVARLMRAVEGDPDNIRYRVELEQARSEAARAHAERSRELMAEESLDAAIEEMEIATKFEPSNRKLAEELNVLRERRARREAERETQSEFEAALERARAASYPVPVLSPISNKPISLNFPDAPLDTVFESLGKMAGINIIFDPDVRGKDKAVDVSLQMVSFQEALDHLTLTNKLFYKVLDGKTLLLAQDSPAKRKAYEEMVLRTFYLQNVDKADEVVGVVTKMLSGSRSLKPLIQGAKEAPIITILGTPDQVALADRVIAALDKARGEVVVEVRILEVSRGRVKSFGIALSNYEASVTFAPTGAAGELSSGTTNVRAHLLSSLNLADFVVSIPSTIFTRFLQSDSTVRLLASPRLRAAEGKKTNLKVGTKVPIAQTSFTAYGGVNTGTGTNQGYTPYTPYTSFNYQDVGVELEFTPKVNPNGEILLDEFMAKFSLLGDERDVGGGLTIPLILSREIGGTLRVRDGETSIIGGLIQGREAKSMSGILGLQSIPLVNKVLGGQSRNTDETEILISLTPHLVRGPTVVEEDLVALSVGTLEQPRIQGARPPLFGEEEAVAASEPPSIDQPGPAAGVPGAPPLGASDAAGSTPETPIALPTSPQTAPVARETRVSAQLSPPEVRLGAGATARISVIARGLREAMGIEAVLVDDSEGAVEVGGIVPGALLTLGGAPAQLSSQRAGNRITVRVSLAGPGPGVTGSGAVAVVTLTGSSAGQGTVRLESLVVTSAGDGVESRAEIAGPSAGTRVSVAAPGTPALPE